MTDPFPHRERRLLITRGAGYVGSVVTASLLEVGHAYGEPQVVPISEDAPTRPTNPCGASKLAVDHVLSSYAVAHDLAAVSLRSFNVAGSLITPDLRLGERHDPDG